MVKREKSKPLTRDIYPDEKTYLKKLSAVYFFIISNIYFAMTLDSFMLIRINSAS